MTDFLVWKYLSEDTVAKLADAFEPENCKALLASSLDLPNSPSNDLLLNFYFYAYAFCKDNGLPPNKVSTFFSILKEVVTYDTSTPYSPHYPLSKSFTLFESLLFKHSISRPPHSTLIFSRSDVKKILDFVSDQYYRLWRVFKVACGGERVILRLEQVGSCGVEGSGYFTGKPRGLERAEEGGVVVTFPEPEPEEEEEGGGEGGEEEEVVEE